jgi:hypothetical protein
MGSADVSASSARGKVDSRKVWSLEGGQFRFGTGGADVYGKNCLSADGFFLTRTAGYVVKTL